MDNLLNGKDEKEEFWRIFFSEEFLRFDEPVPFSANVISDLVKKYDILYLTGRHHDEKAGDSMKEGTRDSLKKYGFPLDEEKTQIYFKDKRDTPDASFKSSTIRSIVAERSVAFGVGDTPDDMESYASFDIFAVAIRTGYFSDKDLSKASEPPLILDGWSEINDLARFMGSRKPDKLLEELVDEYSSYPSSMDNIASFLLLVNTFALGFVLSTFTPIVGSLNLLHQLVLFVSISSLLLSITFGIFVLIPRSITYPHVGEPIMTIPKAKRGEPLKKWKKVVEMSTDETKREWLRFLEEGYRTVDPKAGLTERIFNLRAMSYRKIRWVNRSIVSLLVGMSFLLPLTFAKNLWILVGTTSIVAILGLYLCLRITLFSQ